MRVINSRPADIHLRTDQSGGGAWAKPNPDIAKFRSSARTIVLFHGYNVSHETAMRSFEDFEASLCYAVPALKGQIFTCSWPGDWWIPVVGRIGYPKLVSNAIACAGILAPLIHQICQNRPDSHQIVLIGHSLGCRILLETLRVLVSNNHVEDANRLRIVLMAAAVPLQLVLDKGPLQTAANTPVLRAVLFSGQDTVLSRWFRAGQVFRREGGWWPEAVGLSGRPGAPTWSTRCMAPFAHADYWAHFRTAEVVASLLGFPVRSELATRHIGSAPELPTLPVPLAPWLDRW